MPYVNVLGLSMSPANREAGESVVRAGIDRADCVVDASSIKRPKCPEDRPEQPVTWCLPAKLRLPRVHPKRVALIGPQFPHRPSHRRW